MPGSGAWADAAPVRASAAAARASATAIPRPPATPVGDSGVIYRCRLTARIAGTDGHAAGPPGRAGPVPVTGRPAGRAGRAALSPRGRLCRGRLMQAGPGIRGTRVHTRRSATRAPERVPSCTSSRPSGRSRGRSGGVQRLRGVNGGAARSTGKKAPGTIRGGGSARTRRSRIAPRRTHGI